MNIEYGGSKGQTKTELLGEKTRFSDTYSFPYTGQGSNADIRVWLPKP